MKTCCPTCGVAEFDPETGVCDYCASTGGGSGSDGISIVDVNVDEAKALVAAAPTVDALQALKATEETNGKTPGGRVSVLKAIEKALAEKASA